jgi:hypothetical protein
MKETRNIQKEVVLQDLYRSMYISYLLMDQSDMKVTRVAADTLNSQKQPKKGGYILYRA